MTEGPYRDLPPVQRKVIADTNAKNLQPYLDEGWEVEHLAMCSRMSHEYRFIAVIVKR